MKEKIALRSFLLLISKTVPLAIQMVVIFIYSRQLSFNDYGKYQSLWLFVNVLSVVGLFGLPALILSHSLAVIRTWIMQHKTTFYFSFLLFTLVPSLCFLLFSGEHDITTKILLIALVFIQNVSIIAEIISIKNEKEKLVLFTNIIVATGFLIWHLEVLQIGYSLIRVIIGLIALQIFKTLILFPYKNRQIAFKADVSQHMQTGKQWYFLGISDMLGMLFKWLDKWVILMLLSANQFAIYFNGSYEIPVFALLLSAMGSIMLVELSKQKENFAANFSRININSTLLLSSVVLPSFCFLFLFHHEFFTLLFSTKYIASIPFFIISIFILPVRGTYSTAALQVLNRSDLIVKGALLDVTIAIVLMFILYPAFQARGIALSFVISTYVQVSYYLWHTAKLLNKKITDFFPLKNLIMMMAISMTVIGSARFIFLHQSQKYSLISGMIFCCITIAGFLTYSLKKENNNF